MESTTPTTHPTKDTMPVMTPCQTPSPPKTPKKVRCHICRKAVGAFPIACPCGKPVCLAHMNPQSHQCTYNRVQECRDRIVARNPKVVPSRVTPV